MFFEFTSVTISFFIHSTEDSERLQVLVCERLAMGREELHIEIIQGHYGNEIISAKAHLIGRRAYEVSLEIFRRLSSRSREKLLEELDRSIDEHDSLYLRIDRQSLGSEFGLSDEEPVRVKLKPKHRTGGRESMLANYKDLIR
ncbi:MAG: RNA-binding domain-containing protein [Nitrososphaerales archaeon]